MTRAAASCTPSPASITEVLARRREAQRATQAVAEQRLAVSAREPRRGTKAVDRNRCVQRGLHDATGPARFAAIIAAGPDPRSMIQAFHVYKQYDRESIALCRT